jgi:hypothetical protein
MSKDFLTMRPAAYLSCAFLLGAAVDAQSPGIAADPGLTASASAGLPAANVRRGAKETAPQTTAQNPPSRQDPTTQNAASQNSAPQDALAAQVIAVRNEVVPLNGEPHHQIVLRNDFVQVYSVSVQPLDATLVHRHDLPYLAVSLGATEVANAVVGKPEVRLSLQDGQVIYSPGGFAHAVRTDAGMVFRNVTLELAKPQGAARNVCKQIVAGPLACPQETARSKKPAAEPADDDIPYLETDEVRVDVIKVSSGRDYTEASPKQNAVLVALTNADLDVNLGGEHSSFLHEGDVLWLPAGTFRRISDFLGAHSSFLLVSFKDSNTEANP